MPISVPGPASRTRQQGFSLLEVLIVLVIVGIAAGAVSVSALSDTDGRALRQDATRLALLFSVAQAEARKSGNAVVWEYGIEGYAFAHAPRRLFRPSALTRLSEPAPAVAYECDSPLRPRAWSTDKAVQVQVQPPGAQVFQSEWISGPASVELRDGTNTIRITRAGAGHYEVQP